MGIIYEYGDDGFCVDLLKSRNEQVIKALEPTLEEFLKEKNMLLACKKPPKLGYRFMKQIMVELAKLPRMPAEEYVDLDYETIQNYYLNFNELIAYYNKYFEIVDNKNIFMSYMGIDDRQYEELENHSNDQIKRFMRRINGDYIGMGWIAGESGEADVKATTSRLRASGTAGHSVTSASEDKMMEKVESATPYELQNRLNAILGKNLLNGD